MKYTVITGASSGIGYETAKVLAKQGKSLVLVARRHDELEKLRSEIKAIAPKIDVIIKAKDLSYSENVYGLYESLVDRRGRTKPEDELSEEEKLKRRIQQMELENELLRADILFLKKLEEIERRS